MDAFSSTSTHVLTHSLSLTHVLTLTFSHSHTLTHSLTQSLTYSYSHFRTLTFTTLNQVHARGGGAARLFYLKRRAILNNQRSRLRWSSRCGQFTGISHIPGGGQPLLREGGPISYEARPSASFQPAKNGTLKHEMRIRCTREVDAS